MGPVGTRAAEQNLGRRMVQAKKSGLNRLGVDQLEGTLEGRGHQGTDTDEQNRPQAHFVQGVFTHI